MAASTRDISECGTNHWSARNSQKPVIDSPIPVTGQSLEFLEFNLKNLPFLISAIVLILPFCLILDHPQPFIAQKLTEELPEGDLEKQKKGKVIKFGWIEGVYVSTLSLTFLTVLIL